MLELCISREILVCLDSCYESMVWLHFAPLEVTENKVMHNNVNQSSPTTFPLKKTKNNFIIWKYQATVTIIFSCKWYTSMLTCSLLGFKKKLFTCNTDFQWCLTLGLKESSLMLLFGGNTCFTSALSLDVMSEPICALSQTPLKSAAQYMSAFHSTSWGSICAHSCLTSSLILKKQAT